MLYGGKKTLDGEESVDGREEPRRPDTGGGGGGGCGVVVWWCGDVVVAAGVCRCIPF